MVLVVVGLGEPFSYTALDVQANASISIETVTAPRCRRVWCEPEPAR
jgi:hypothetical protein